MTVSQRFTASSGAMFAYSGDCARLTKETVTEALIELISLSSAYFLTAASSELCVGAFPPKSEEKSRTRMRVEIPLVFVTLYELVRLTSSVLT